MTPRKQLKYGILAALLLLSWSTNIHFGDFCEGMVEPLLFFFLSLIFIVCFKVILVRDLYKYFKKKEKFDFIPLYILILFILSNWFLIVANENKYWRKIKYEGVVENKNSRVWLILYENNSFEATKSYADFRCTTVGNYHFEENSLILDAEDIEEKTDHNFTKRYLILSDTLLQPTNRKFNRIVLKRK